MSFILALDQGTTSSRALVFDERGAVRAVAQKEFRQIFPQSGWVEHDPNEIWATELAVATEALALAGATASDVAAIGITNQRETTIVWDRASGEPVSNAIVWQDRRTAPMCDALRAQGKAELIARKTGLVLDPARLREQLPEFLLRHRLDRAGRVEHDRARAGGALIQCQYMIHRCTRFTALARQIHIALTRAHC